MCTWRGRDEGQRKAGSGSCQMPQFSESVSQWFSESVSHGQFRAHRRLPPALKARRLTCRLRIPLEINMDVDNSQVGAGSRRSKRVRAQVKAELISSEIPVVVSVFFNHFLLLSVDRTPVNTINLAFLKRVKTRSSERDGGRT